MALVAKAVLVTEALSTMTTERSLDSPTCPRVPRLKHGEQFTMTTLMIARMTAQMTAQMTTGKNVMTIFRKTSLAVFAAFTAGIGNSIKQKLTGLVLRRFKLRIQTLLACAAALLGAGVQGSAIAAEDGEVIRIEDLSRYELNNYIIEAEDQLYALFNSLNSTDRFDIVCRKEKKTGSNIPERVCPPNFLIEESATNVSDFMFGGRALAADSAVITGSSSELEALQKEMAELIQSNDQMREIAGILQLLRKRLAQL